MNISEMVSSMFVPILDFFKTLLIVCVLAVLSAVFLFFFLFYCRYGINPFKPSLQKLRSLRIKFKPYNLFRWLLCDWLTRAERRGFFKECGFTIFCGRQGSGKTISMVDYLNCLREKYPECLIVTNFKYAHADFRMVDWRDLLKIRNGEKGVIFAIDEIQNEYSAESWKDFPESLLSEICMQRKQKIKIVSTAQVFSRVVKQIREQTFSVVMCATYFNRYTKITEYDAADYSTSDTPYMVKKKCKPLRKYSFVQSDELRDCYDTYEVIERMEKIRFINRSER